MGFLDSLADILSGRRHHKNTTNNVVVSALWSRCASLPVQQDLFREYMVSASIVADQFFFAADHPKEINAKDYTIVQFAHFYEAIITFLTFVEGVNHPNRKTILRRCLFELATHREFVSKLLAQLDGRASVDRVAVGLVYNHLMQEAGIGVKAVAPFVVFTVACLAACDEQDG